MGAQCSCPRSDPSPPRSPLYSYILWYAEGCYEIEAVEGTVTTKLKGVDRTNGTGIFENAGDLTWDEAEYVIPPQVGGVCVSQCEQCSSANALYRSNVT